MKKVLFIVALLVSTASLSMAQGGGQGGGRPMGTPEERAKMTIDGQRLTSLALTDDQKAKLLPLLVKANKSIDSLRATAPQGDRDAMMALMPKMTAFTAPAETALISWLTPEQKKAYDAALAAAKERNPNATGILGGGFGGRGGQGGGQGGQRPANN
ncbi:Spy/CpxP family protein refolding chaperone [Hufsiella ginkgonis]|uniref:Spy/CpxP family protein refolding chaperone n=1 Tax=Hufsiella ginkgonis TaxID=2695274 RepID=A0A7K1XXG3_9SPHI|nr:Spy/CpxP family protein refolding chaperone [Hufsiella ginkgonis]MXV15518.1 hypothetical protein [Hufsiella ginkgonis]